MKGELWVVGGLGAHLGTGYGARYGRVLGQSARKRVQELKSFKMARWKGEGAKAITLEEWDTKHEEANSIGSP